MKFKLILTSLLLGLFIVSDLSAQRTSIPRDNQGSQTRVVESEGFTKENLFIEPQVGFSVTNAFTQLSLTPYFGYAFNDKISAGIGGGYSFVKQNGFEDRIKQWQMAIFGQAQIIGEELLNGSRVFLRAELGRVLVNPPGVFMGEDGYLSETILPIGGGVRLSAGRVTLVNMNVMYNILYTDSSLLGSPFIYQPSIRWYFLRDR